MCREPSCQNPAMTRSRYSIKRAPCSRQFVPHSRHQPSSPVMCQPRHPGQPRGRPGRASQDAQHAEQRISSRRQLVWYWVPPPPPRYGTRTRTGIEVSSSTAARVVRVRCDDGYTCGECIHIGGQSGRIVLPEMIQVNS